MAHWEADDSFGLKRRDSHGEGLDPKLFELRLDAESGFCGNVAVNPAAFRLFGKRV